MAYWLFKTEPNDYSWLDLKRDGQVMWDGVKAPAALNHMARIQAGDLVYIYHTGKERAVVGIAEVIGGPRPNPNEDNEDWLVVDIVPREPLTRPITLKEIKESGLFPQWELVRLPRLSVMPVSPTQWEQILKWGEHIKG